MFRDIEADCYLLVDGDDTYDEKMAGKMVEPVLSHRADMVVGDRLSNGSYGKENKRAFHGFGNNLVKSAIKWIYGYAFEDVMTGYRALSREFVKTFPVMSRGFEIETELSIHAVDRGWRIVDVPIRYRDRPEGSVSKLDTVSDGIKILRMIGVLFKDYRPLRLFLILAALLFLCGLAYGVPVLTEFAVSGIVSKLPSAVLAVGFMFLAALSVATGFVLDSIAKAERKQWELAVYDAMSRQTPEVHASFGRTLEQLIASRLP